MYLGVACRNARFDGKHELAASMVASLQTHGSRAIWHPRLHLLVTNGRH